MQFSNVDAGTSQLKRPFRRIWGLTMEVLEEQEAQSLARPKDSAVFFENFLLSQLFHLYISCCRAGIVLFLSVIFIMVAWLPSFFMCNQGELNYLCLANVTESVYQKQIYLLPCTCPGCRHPTSQPTSLQPKLGAAWRMTIQTSQDHYQDSRLTIH